MSRDDEQDGGVLSPEAAPLSREGHHVDIERLWAAVDSARLHSSLLDSELSEVIVRVGHQVRAAASLERSMSSLQVEVSPQQAHRAQATENAWRQMDREFGLLTSTDVSEKVGAGRSYASDARRAGRLMGVKRLNRIMYPGFQFGPAGPLKLISDLRRTADELGVKEAAALLWMTAPTTWWGDDSRPVDHLDDPGEVLRSFRNHYGVEW